ncbi:hypothetical protein NFI96_022149, partial [Prochilodus magdalenae]
SLLQVASCTGTCETVFKGFSDCLLSLGENMVNYPQELDDRENLRTICSVMAGIKVPYAAVGREQPPGMPCSPPTAHYTSCRSGREALPGLTNEQKCLSL